MKLLRLALLAAACSIPAAAYADSAPSDAKCASDTKCSVVVVSDAVAAKLEKQDHATVFVTFDGKGTQAQLASIAKLPWLQQLKIDSDHVTDLTPLAALKSLRRLDLSTHEVKDLTPLAALPLEDLDLGITAIKDLTPLAGKTTLHRLVLPTLGIDDVTPLKTCAGLETLWMSGGPADASFVASLPHLEELYLDSSPLKDLTALAKAKSLRRLSIGMSSSLADVSGLGALVDLEALSLYGEPVSDISVVAKMPKLQKLSLRNTKVASIAALTKLTNLKDVDLTGTAVKDLSPLLGSAKTLTLLDVPAGTTEAQLAPLKAANSGLNVSIAAN